MSEDTMNTEPRKNASYVCPVCGFGLTEGSHFLCLRPRRERPKLAIGKHPASPRGNTVALDEDIQNDGSDVEVEEP